MQAWKDFSMACALRVLTVNCPHSNADETGNTDLKLLLCATCSTAEYARDRDAAANALDSAGLGDQVMIESVACLGGCEEPASIGLQAPSRASYVFSGVDTVSDASDIAATCRTYLAADKGWIEDARACGRLRFCLRARIPAWDPV